MKFLLVVSFYIFSCTVYGQDKFVGNYYNHFGSEFKLNSDSTFEYTWRFDLASSWTNGIWHVGNDTIYLQAVPVYDTLRSEANKGNVINAVNSIVLSSNSKAESITKAQHIVSGIVGGGQNRQAIPTKLYFRRKKLFMVDTMGN